MNGTVVQTTQQQQRQPMKDNTEAMIKLLTNKINLLEIGRGGGGTHSSGGNLGGGKKNFPSNGNDGTQTRRR